ncbi:equilibrative nucleoside transporter 2 isoform X1 [Crotalus tigris]|uniref:equilibrative nucleoside transporter 2 isoform X1 n=2 Tax=Crotalus tigris TaxID=88082 RepID=UPI00192F9631|nr:equilibrative nucleoside transporter 2 isoform X1 [Crotalus tigris]XP_039222191.1 equilibrative nucleoside transporter 2 isoform X1 [Crotalus tigris]
MGPQGKPKDMFHCVGIIFFLLGLGTLLPWNFFITAIPYFEKKLGGNCSAGREAAGNQTTSNPPPVSGCKDEFSFSNWLALLSQLPLLLFTFLNSLLYRCISDKVRILGSLTAILFLFVLTAILVKLTMSPQSFFSITMASVWFINSFCAVLQGSLFGLLGSFPQRYSTLVLSGQGMAGMFAAIAMLLSKASGLDDQSSALIYFVTPCAGTLVSIGCYLFLPHQSFSRYYLDKRPAEDLGYELETKAVLLSPDLVADSSKGEPLNVKNGNAGVVEQDGLARPPEVMNGGSGVGMVAPNPSIFSVLKKIWLLALSIVMDFSITLSVFPAITTKVISSTQNLLWQDYFTPVCCFLLFNVMDWLGRSSTSYFLWPKKHLRLLPAAVGLRILLIPMFLLCNIPRKTGWPVLFPHDAWFVILMVAFSLSNGYFVSLTMCLAPKQVQPEESELAGAIMTFFLALGLSCGAGLSFLLRLLL